MLTSAAIKVEMTWRHYSALIKSESKNITECTTTIVSVLCFKRKYNFRVLIVWHTDSKCIGATIWLVSSDPTSAWITHWLITNIKYPPSFYWNQAINDNLPMYRFGETASKVNKANFDQKLSNKIKKPNKNESKHRIICWNCFAVAEFATLRDVFSFCPFENIDG